jgi:hypothetical protein
MSYSSLALGASAQAGLVARLRAGARRHLALLAAATTLLLGWGALLATYRSTPLVLPKSVAVRAAMADRATARLLAPLHWDRVVPTAMDHRYEILGFYRGGRIVATVTIGYHRRPVILDSQNLTKSSYMYGANVANDPRVLAVLGVVFALMVGVWPLWRMRNLDVLALASLASTVVLFNRGLLGTMAFTAYPVLVYLALRCAWWGLRLAGGAAESAPAVPLYEHLTRRWGMAERTRILRMTALAAAVVLAMVGLTSPNVLDVGYAVMEGATGLVHGVLPYGHIPDVLHGDTYPLGSYLAYTPLAWLTPVRNVWENADAALAVAVAAGLLVAFGIGRMSRTTAGSEPADGGESKLTGLRIAIAALTFPPLLVTVSTGTTDVLLAGLLILVLLLWRRPGWSVAALSGAVWFKLVPLAIVPVLFARLRGRATWRAVAALATVSGAMVACLLLLGGAGAPIRMISAMAFQFTRGSQHTLWAVIGSVPLQQLAQAATLALIVGSVIRARRDPAFAADRGRVAAVCGAALLGLQISANYWNYMYLVWAFPFIALSLLRDPRRIATREPD